MVSSAGHEAATQRIANPVTGRTDADWTIRETHVPLHRLLSRYLFVLTFPVIMLVGPTVPSEWGWVFPLLTMLVLVPLGRVAHGSWWTPAPFGGWQAAGMVECGVLVLALGWTIAIDDPAPMVTAATFLIGAVLGVGASQLWRWRAARR
ncbi:hypothetical protein [Agrococcus beijingensis]|uniref:hypothetical protein n=1 Tax=Agrococcus beijingensis TaxID=3068634 RepID=UPI002740BA76|nr:hypothetical protein [Agrococcus sp. REN33]